MVRPTDQETTAFEKGIYSTHRSQERAYMACHGAEGWGWFLGRHWCQTGRGYL